MLEFLWAAHRIAGRAGKVAEIRDLEERDATVLLVLWADSAVVRAGPHDSRVVAVSLFGRLDEDFTSLAEVVRVVGKKYALLSVLRASFLQVNSAVLDQYLRQYSVQALEAQCHRVRIEKVGTGRVGVVAAQAHEFRLL